jgi:hypothetical protein
MKSPVYIAYMVIFHNISYANCSMGRHGAALAVTDGTKHFCYGFPPR